MNQELNYPRAQEKQSQGILGRWYRIASPTEPSPMATLTEHETFRRGRLGSIIMLIMLILCILSLPAGFFGTNPKLVPILLVLFVLTVVAIFFNRRGYVNVAGVIVVVAFESGIIGNISTTPGGLNTITLPLLCLLVMPEVLAVSLLPAWNVFVVALANSLICWILITFLPYAPDSAAAISAAYWYAILLPVNLQIIVAGVTFLYVRGATQALKRADHAEEVAKLEHNLAERDRATAAQKQQLDAAIAQIEHALEAFANGDPKARVPLTNENVLWSIAGKLNNFLNRFQRSAQAENYLRWTTQEIERFAAIIHTAKVGKTAIRSELKGSPVDVLMLELNGNEVETSTPQRREVSN